MAVVATSVQSGGNAEPPANPPADPRGEPAAPPRGLAWDGLVDPGTLARFEAARAGMPTQRRLRLAALQPGDVGVLECTVRSVSAVRTFARSRGGEGLLARVTLVDGSGECDLVLWDQETQRIAAGDFAPGLRLRLRGASVKAGYRGGIELGLGSALVERVAPARGAEASGASGADGQTLEGTLSLGSARNVDGRLQADAVVNGQRIALSGALLEAARGLDGGLVRIGPLQPNPVLPGFWLVTASTTLEGRTGAR